MKGKKTGGRQKGTPNKENPLKDLLRHHSNTYFTPGHDGQSDFDKDLEALSPDDRVNAELRILEFHTPKMKSVEIDLEATVEAPTIERQLSLLCGEDPDEE